MRGTYKIEIKYHDRDKYRHRFFNGSVYANSEEEAKEIAIISVSNDMGYRPYVYKCQVLSFIPVENLDHAVDTLALLAHKIDKGEKVNFKWMEGGEP